MNNYMATTGAVAGVNPTFILVIALWGLFWKGLALWHSARRGHHVWFLALLVVNVLGILEIIYLLGILKLKPKEFFKK